MVDSLLTQLVHHSPVLVGDRKPLTVALSDVDVDRTEIVVLLVT